MDWYLKFCTELVLAFKRGELLVPRARLVVMQQRAFLVVGHSISME